MKIAPPSKHFQSKIVYWIFIGKIIFPTKEVFSGYYDIKLVPLGSSNEFIGLDRTQINEKIAPFRILTITMGLTDMVLKGIQKSTDDNEIKSFRIQLAEKNDDTLILVGRKLK